MRTLKPFRGKLLNRSHVLAKGLIGCWLLNENNGDKAHDYSGNNGIGTLENMESADWIAGKNGNALNFDGVNEYVKCGASAVLDVTSRITVSVITKPESNIDHTLLSKGDNYEILFLEGLNAWIFRYLDASLDDHYYMMDNGINFSVWQHVLVTFEAGNSIQFYIDGKPESGAWLIGDGTKAMVPDTAELNIAAYKNIYTRYPGVVENAMLWNRLFSDAEVRQLFSNPYCMFE